MLSPDGGREPSLLSVSASIAAAVLGLDTATAEVAVAATRRGEVLFETQVASVADARPNHSSVLLEAVEEAVRAAGGWPAVGLIAAGVGPGAFTGLRVGVATARALAQARDLDLAGVSSLAALARGIREHTADVDGSPPSTAPRQRPLLALIDARRAEVFAALFDCDGVEVWEPCVISADELQTRIESLPEPPVAAGDGSLRFRAELEAAGAEVPPDADPAHRLSARHVCALAGGAGRARPEDVRPIYLRRPDAEVWREQQGGGGPRR